MQDSGYASASKAGAFFVGVKAVEVEEIEIIGITIAKPKPYQAAYERFCEVLQSYDCDWEAARHWLEHESGFPERGKQAVLKRAIERNMSNIRCGVRQHGR